MSGTSIGTTSATTLRFPTQVFSDGTKLFVVDTGNSRILIWNTVPTTTQQAADVVVGQTTMAGNSPAVSATGLSSPNAAWVAGGRLFVADSGSSRVLIWNTVPTANGAAADVVLGQASMTTAGIGTTSTTMFLPEGVYSDGTKVFVADAMNNRILVWNTVPTTNGQAADAVIGQANLTSGRANTGGMSGQTLNTPYGVFGDGVNLYISDALNSRILMLSLVR
jgi:hypothetical protein